MSDQPKDSVLDQIRHALQTYCEFPPERAAAITAADSLPALDVDSIQMAYLFSYFEKTYDVSFLNGDLMQERYPTVGDLAAVIEQRIAKVSP